MCSAMGRRVGASFGSYSAAGGWVNASSGTCPATGGWVNASSGSCSAAGGWVTAPTGINSALHRQGNTYNLSDTFIHCAIVRILKIKSSTDLQAEHQHLLKCPSTKVSAYIEIILSALTFSRFKYIYFLLIKKEFPEKSYQQPEFNKSQADNVTFSLKEQEKSNPLLFTLQRC